MSPRARSIGKTVANFFDRPAIALYPLSTTLLALASVYSTTVVNLQHCCKFTKNISEWIKGNLVINPTLGVSRSCCYITTTLLYI
jgi:hypothetical protein